MSTLTLLLMLFVAFMLSQAGQFFFAFLILVLALVMVLSSGKEKSSPPSGMVKNSPIIMHGGGAGFPEQVKFRFQPNWGGPKSGDEQIASNVGSFVNFVGSSAASLGRFLFGKKKDD